MSLVGVSQWTPRRMQPQFWARNGCIPSAIYHQQLAALANQLRRYRVKELFRSSGNVGFDPGGVSTILASQGTRARWRFVGHTSPQTSLVIAKVLCAMPTISADSYVQLDLNNSIGGNLATGQYHFQAVNPGGADNPSTFINAFITLTSASLQDADVYGVFTDTAQFRLLCASVYEVGPWPDTQNGYIGQTFSVGGSIYDTHRADIAMLANSLWKRSGASVFHWHSTDGLASVTTQSATHTNLIDGTSTAPGAATPGYTLDMRYKTTIALAGTGVPCVMGAYGNRTGGTANQQFVELVDSGGTAIATIGNFGTTPGWQTTTLNLPATLAKYDLRFWAASGTFSLGAVSVYEYQ